MLSVGDTIRVAGGGKDLGRIIARGPLQHRYKKLPVAERHPDPYWEFFVMGYVVEVFNKERDLLSIPFTAEEAFIPGSFTTKKEEQ